MMEALRLTRQGKLQEAMAVLQGGPAVAEAASTRATEQASFIDMVPPADPNSGAWTPAQGSAEPGGAARPIAAASAGDRSGLDP